MPHPMTFERARSVAVVGSGTAGLFAALALRQVRPDLDVAIVATSSIPIIGVGEATTPPIVAFLHGFLGIDPVAFFRAVRPTFKLGIRFEWGPPSRPFHYAFGGGDLGAARVHEGGILDYSFTSRLMSIGAGPVLRERGTAGERDRLRPLLGDQRFAYHLDNAPFVAFLECVAAARGIRKIDAKVTGARRDDVGGIEALTIDGGADLAFDAYVDATGFRSQLLGGVMEVPFTPWDASLFCDTAVVGNGPLEADGPHPFTRATTMRAGWRWTIPMRAENHYGYVFASRFLDPVAAEAELRAAVPIEGETRIVRFRSGRRERLIAGNVASVGNAYGFVEPLESTALHMAIATSLRLAALATGASESAEAVSEEIAAQWDYLRGFLAMHYRFNTCVESPFWTACRADVVLTPLEEALEDYQRGTLFTQRSALPTFVRDTVFGARGLDIVLLGQDVLPGSLAPEVTRATWNARRAGWSTLEAEALPQAEALEALDAEPALLSALAASTESRRETEPGGRRGDEGWFRALTDAMRGGAPARTRDPARRRH